MSFQGFKSHGLHLFSKDIFAATKQSEVAMSLSVQMGIRSSTYSIFFNKCKEFVKFFHNHHGRKSQLKLELPASKLKMLALMAPTRWGSIQAIAETMLAAEAALHQLITSRKFITGNASQKKVRQDVIDTVTAAGFVDFLNKTLTILKPIDSAITCSAARTNVVF
jgi:hypothetical protein